MTRVSVRAVWVVDDDVSSAGAYSIVMTGPPQPPPPPYSHPAPPPLSPGDRWSCCTDQSPADRTLLLPDTCNTSTVTLRSGARQTFQLSWCSRLSEWYILSFCLVLHLSETSCTLWDSYRRLSGGNILSSSSSSEVLKSYSWSLRRRMLHLIPHKHYFTRYAHLQFDWSTNNITTTRLHPTIFLVVQENYIWHFLLQSIVFNSILSKSVPLDTIYWSWAILTRDRVASVASFHTPYYKARVLLDAISGSEIFTF